MTTGGVGELVRRLEESAQTTFPELFFDVVFVFALRALAQVLIKNLAIGAYRTLVLTLAIGWMRALTARITSRFNP